jgi:hypothetical protein
MSVGARVAAVIAAVVLCYPVTSAAQEPPTFKSGDVFLSVGGGVVYVYRLNEETGSYELQPQTLSTGQFSFRTTGSAFDKAGRFYVTLFNNQGEGPAFQSGPVYRFQRDFDLFAGHEPVAVETFGTSPESIAFDAAGNMFVGHRHRATPARPCFPPPPGVIPRGDVITKIAPDGTCLAAYDVEHEGLARPLVPVPRPDDPSDPAGDSLDPQGADWIDLSGDQRTLFYTSAGRRIMRFDTFANVQLADFANLSDIDVSHGQLFALRLLGNGNVLVADNVNIKLLNPAGVVIKTYDLDVADGFASHDNWFSLNLDPDGESFWSGDGRTGLIHKFNIQTGQRLASFPPVAEGYADTLFGVAIFDEITQGSTQCRDTVLAMSAVEGSNCSTLSMAATLTCAGQAVPGKTIAFSLNGSLYQAVTDNAGLATVGGIAPPPQLGTISNALSAQFAGDDQFAAVGSSADLRISDASTLTLENVGGATCDVLSFTARMVCGTTPVAGKTIEFFLNGASVGAQTTNAEGIAILANVASPTQPGTVSDGVSAQFAGDAQYGVRSVSAKLELTDGCPPPPVTCQPTLVLAPVTGSACGKVTLSATLLCGTTPLAERMITFVANGTTMGQAQTGADGVARLPDFSVPSGAAAGTYTDAITASFAGDGTNLEVQSSATLTLTTCTTRPPGSHPKDCRNGGPGHDHPRYPPAPKPIHHPGDGKCKNPVHHHPRNDNCPDTTRTPQVGWTIHKVPIHRLYRSTTK